MGPFCMLVVKNIQNVPLCISPFFKGTWSFMLWFLFFNLSPFFLFLTQWLWTRWWHGAIHKRRHCLLFVWILLIRDMVVERCNRWFGCETIHPTQKFNSMNLLQMPCVITYDKKMSLQPQKQKLGRFLVLRGHCIGTLLLLLQLLCTLYAAVLL